LPNKRTFLSAFIIAGLTTKIVAEVIHEVLGHGTFVLLFGGSIRTVHISLLWPYELSYITWSLPRSSASEALVWVYSGGILACAVVSFVAQVFILSRKEVWWPSALFLFWLAFWTLTNSAGYLLFGGLALFGDVHELVRLGALSSVLSVALGAAVFAVGFFTLSEILRSELRKLVSWKAAGSAVCCFWLLVPLLFLVAWANPERGSPVTAFPLAFLPALFSFAFERFLTSSEKKPDDRPDNVPEEQGGT